MKTIVISMLVGLFSLNFQAFASEDIQRLVLKNSAYPNASYYVSLEFQRDGKNMIIESVEHGELKVRKKVSKEAVFQALGEEEYFMVNDSEREKRIKNIKLLAHNAANTGGIAFSAAMAGLLGYLTVEYGARGDIGGAALSTICGIAFIIAPTWFVTDMFNGNGYEQYQRNRQMKEISDKAENFDSCSQNTAHVELYLGRFNDLRELLLAL